jgi:two-component system, chemotaxis family, chemotaxis protein CheY
MEPRLSKPVEAITRSLRVLLVAERQHIRKLVRGLLVNSGIKTIHEAADGIAGIEAIKAFDPDVVILDWDLPLLSGPEVVRIIRAPGKSAKSDVPIIMIGTTASRRRVAEAKRIGVDAFLLLPMSAKTLLDRVLAALANARRPAEPKPAAASAPSAASDPPSTICII